MNERRFDGGAWAVLIIAAAWCVLSGAGSMAALGYPSDGWTITRNSVSGASRLNYYFHPGPSPLQTDDIVVAIEGQPIGPNSTAPVGPGTRAGQVLGYGVERDGQRMEIPVTLAAPGPWALGPSILRRLGAQPDDFIPASIGFAVMLAAFLVRPGNLGARYLLLMYSYYFAVQWFGFTVSDLYVPVLPAWVAVLKGLEGSGWVWFFFPSITLVALSFPVVKWPLRRFPRLLPGLLYGIPGAAAVLSFGPQIGLFADNGLSDLALPVFMAVLAVTVLTLAATLIHNWLTLREPATRAQLRWVTLGVAVGLVVPFGGLLAGLALSGSFPATDLWLWAFLCLPVSLAIAITRYRLFDIDVIIRRTLIYSALTAVLALAYFGSVVALQSILSAVTGESRSALATVLSTLAIAALFGTVRGRVQAFIDRRFYRRKYDTARTLAAFGAQARDEVDLTRLSDHLVGVVEATMQPASVTLWLKPTERKAAQDVSRPAA